MNLDADTGRREEPQPSWTVTHHQVNTLHMLVARDHAGEDVGGLHFTKYPDHIELHSLVVPEESRRKGMGSTLLRALEEHAGDQDIQAHGKHTRAGRDLMTSVGWSQRGRNRGWGPHRDPKDEMKEEQRL